MTTKNTENSRTKVDGQVGIAGEEARGWYGALDKNKKAAIRELTKLQPRWNLVILMYLGIWVASAVLMAVWPLISWSSSGISEKFSLSTASHPVFTRSFSILW